MLRIFRMGMVFLKNSKMLTFSAFLSIFFACFLSISMFQLSTSAEEAFEQNVSKEKGDFDATLLHKENFVFMPKEGTMTSTEMYYYFDTDNNPADAEMMLQVTNHNNGAFLNAYNKGTIGKTQTSSEWHNDLTDNKSIYIYYQKEIEKQ